MGKLLFSILITIMISFQSISAVDIVFNGFTPSSFLLYGNATVDARTLSLTQASPFSVGRALNPSPIPTRNANSSIAVAFFASFIFSMARVDETLPGHGIAFVFTPRKGIDTGTSAQQLGLFSFLTNGDRANRVVAVEFDVLGNQEFGDLDDNHVGVNVFSLTSNVSHTAGYYSDSSPSELIPLLLNDGRNYQAWIDYSNAQLNITMAPVTVPTKPSRPLISARLDFSPIFKDRMYVGFSAATGARVQHHRVLAFSFSNSNSSLYKSLVTSDLPDFVLRTEGKGRWSTGAVAGVVAAGLVFTVAVVVGVLVVKRRGRDGKAKVDFAEEWEVEYWPHRVRWEEVVAATGGFAEDSLVGSGGSGMVYKGCLGGMAVAVKVFYRITKDEHKGFLAEVSTLGRLRHRNLVTLRGWSRKLTGDLILIYDYMHNGSLDERLFSTTLPPLDWATKVQILRDVASGVVYLHEGWSHKVLHRDIKSSNILLDTDMSAKLGDFGMAQVDQGDLRTTRVVGTIGYIAPETFQTGKASVASDVYSFGVVVLEVACQRKAVAEEGTEPLVAWALGMVKAFTEEEVRRVVGLGLWCVCEDPRRRPTMREVVRVLEGGEVAVEEYLLEKLKATVPPVGSRSLRRNVALDEVRVFVSGPASLSESDLLVEGR